MKVTIESDAIYVSEEHELDGVWNQKRKAWKIPNNVGALEEVNKISPSKGIADMIRARQLARRKVLNLKRLKDAEGLQSFRPYQRVDTQYLSKLPHVGLFSEMRTGKTPIAVQLLEAGLNIVVCPASIIFQWEDEIKKWRPEVETYVISGTKSKRNKIYSEIADTFTKKAKDSDSSKAISMIISYETLRQDILTLRSLTQLSTFVADEAHRICNHKTGISKACQAIGKLAKKRVAITGTPVRNKPQDIFGILAFLYPERYTGYWQFVDRYFEVEIVESQDGERAWKEVVGYKREKELTDIIDLISVNRKRREVMKWLPKKQYILVKLEMNADQKKVYDSVLKTFEYEEDGELKVDASGVLPQLTRLRQITLSPEILDIKASSAKENYILEWLNDNPDEQVIIFSSFSSYLRILLKKIKGAAIIDGQVSKAHRADIVKRFQAGKLRVILANIIAGGVGLTLDNAETAIFLDKDYTPVNNDQAEDRIIPVTEDRNHSCTVISLVAKGTVDERVEAILRRKQSVISTINDIGFKNFMEG